jgi:hypothetical protein
MPVGKVRPLFDANMQYTVMPIAGETFLKSIVTLVESKKNFAWSRRESLNEKVLMIRFLL